MSHFALKGAPFRPPSTSTDAIEPLAYHIIPDLGIILVCNITSPDAGPERGNVYRADLPSYLLNRNRQECHGQNLFDLCDE
jgi:hypothetical protein